MAEIETETTKLTPEVDPSTVEDIGVLRENYKNLQRQLDKARKRGSEDMATQVMLENVQAAQDQDRKLLHTVLKSQADEGSEDVGTLLEQHEQEATQRKAMSNARLAIGELTNDADVDWEDDPKLNKAREAYNSGDFTKAVEETRGALIGGPDQVPDLVAAEVQKALKAKGIDVGESTASPVPSDNLETLLKRDIHTMSQQELTTHKKAITNAWSQQDGISIKLKP